MINIGERSGAEIIEVTTVDELESAWSDLGSRSVAGAQVWIEEVAQGNNSIYIAKLGGVAAGIVTVKWTGPSEKEPEVTEALTEAFPGQAPIATIYGLAVHDNFKRRYVAWDLMERAEGGVYERPNLNKRTALGVEVTNQAAIILYETRGYRRIYYHGQESVVLDTPTNADRQIKVPSYIMSKDLSSQGIN